MRLVSIRHEIYYTYSVIRNLFSDKVHAGIINKAVLLNYFLFSGVKENEAF
jgi:hypothetical protein